MRLIILLTLSVFFAFSNCQTNKPSSDSTPPVVRWVVLNKETNVKSNITGDGSINAKIGDSFSVTEIVDDPEGVQYIELSVSYEWGCISGDIGQNSGPSLGVPESQTLSPDANGKVLNSIFLLRDIETTAKTFPCNSNYTFSGGIIRFYGKGKNYFNGETKSTLSFVFSK